MDYPSVDISFFIAQMQNTGKLIDGGHITSGKSHAFIFDGHSPLHRRRYIVREFDDAGFDEPQVNFMQATGIAIVCGFMGTLLSWYEANRDWKEGAYKV